MRSVQSWLKESQPAWSVQWDNQILVGYVNLLILAYVVSQSNIFRAMAELLLYAVTLSSELSRTDSGVAIRTFRRSTLTCGTSLNG